MNKKKNSTSEKHEIESQEEEFLAGALERLLGAHVDVELERFDFKSTIQDFAKEWMNVVPFEILGVEETLVFQKDEKDLFILVAPTTTFLLYLDAYLGLDIEELCSNESLWSEFSQELSARAAMTEEERTAFEVAAPSLGILNSSWGKGEENRLDGKNGGWKTTFTENDLANVAGLLNGDIARWSIYSFQLRGRTFHFALISPFLTSNGVANGDGKGQGARTFQDLNEIKKDCKTKVCIRIAEGRVSEDVLRNLKPGDVLTTDAPADKLFEAIVDGKVAFLVKAGLFQGTPAVQVKEILGGGVQGKD
ncbi:MAG: FliM/FliN family flagellar motor switch protein [Thermoguttaceae bacterium]